MTNHPLLLVPLLLNLVGGIFTLALGTQGAASVLARLRGVGFDRAHRMLNTMQRWVAVFLAAIALGVVLTLVLQTFAADAPLTYRLGGWQPPYGIVLVMDGLSALFTLMLSLVSFAVLLYTAQCRDDTMNRDLYIPLALFNLVGLNGVFITGDIFTFFVFMEVTVMSSVVLVASADTNKSPNKGGIEAAIKYLLISAMGTLFLLVGIGLVYAAFGTLNMADIGLQSSEGTAPALAGVGAAVLLCAMLLKSAVAPFHYWQPDFHTAAPTPMSALLSSVVVKIGIYGIFRLVTLMFPEFREEFGAPLVILGVIGVIFGGLNALQTHNLKRLLAYSTLGQIGFILVALGWGGVAGLTAAIVFSFNHALIKSAMLMLAGLIASRTKEKTADLIRHVGLGRGMPLISLLFFVGALALAGIPPLNGFIGKLAVVQAGVGAQGWLGLGLTIGGGILTLMYGMKTWQRIFQSEHDHNTAPLKPFNQGDSPLAPALLIGLCVVLGLAAAPLVNAALVAATRLMQPSLYISAVLSLGGG
jgi:multicomponent Na+:H+ antiporter subunit D